MIYSGNQFSGFYTTKTLSGQGNTKQEVDDTGAFAF